MHNSSIFKLESNIQFENKCLEVFHFQAKNVEIYQKYLQYLNIKSESIKSIDKIPFLPISLFKTEKIIAKNCQHEIVFTSSGTTGAETSKHFVKDLSLYEESFNTGFDFFYGKPQDYCILALLPSYLEREGSSLIYMTEKLIEKSNNPNSGFYLTNLDELVEKLTQQEAQQKQSLLIGVSFALLDLVEKYTLNLKHTIVMETGGMKGKRKELTRSELHEILTKGLGVETIHSEYGMTELLSQAYSTGQGIFKTPHWMKILIRDVYDPFTYLESGKTGGINVIDLANINSCSFIETQDLGKQLPNNSFEILGRFDTSSIRGCNLLVNS